MLVVITHIERVAFEVGRNTCTTHIGATLTVEEKHGIHIVCLFEERAVVAQRGLQVQVLNVLYLATGDGKRAISVDAVRVNRVGVGLGIVVISRIITAPCLTVVLIDGRICQASIG